MNQLRVKRIGDHNLPLPKLHSDGAAAFDLQANLSGPEYVLDPRHGLLPGHTCLIGCGFAFEIPAGYEGSVRGRSGLAFHHSLFTFHGTIDSDYRGEVGVVIRNLGKEPFTIYHRDRIAQLIIHPVLTPELVEVGELTETKRGSGGFGSTGR